MAPAPCHSSCSPWCSLVRAALPACSLKASSTLSASQPRKPHRANLALVYHIPPPPCAARQEYNPRREHVSPAPPPSMASSYRWLGPSPMHVATSSSARPTPSSSPRPLMPRSPTTSPRPSGGTRRSSCAVPALLVAKVGTTFGCTATVAGVRRQVVVDRDEPRRRPALQGAPVQALCLSQPRAGPLGSTAAANTCGAGAVGGAPTRPAGRRCHPSPL